MEAYSDGRRFGWRPSLYLCIYISLSLFSLDLSFSFLRVAIFLSLFFKRLVSFYTKRALKQCFYIGKHYNLSLLNGVVALPNNVIYRFLTYTWPNFRWAFFLHGSTSLIVGINFLSASAIIYSI